uniref:non-specific serine/threonine protein kinase n=1 Tax=Gongylonema pulchrum TaxID=637853 RepID=A0A183E9X3_9BILA
LGRRIGFYRLGKELGAGNFSKVKLGVHCLTDEKVAVKIMEKSKMDQKAQKLLASEIRTMEQLHHPNVIRLFEHSKNIVHRDIKSENVIFSKPGWIKLADFGFSCQVYPNDKLSTFCGSPPYAAPELFKGEEYAGLNVDVWALGVLLYFMLVGTTPFRGETINDLKQCVLRGIYVVPDYISTFAHHAIGRMLVVDPKKRGTIEDVKKVYFLRESKFTKPYAQCSTVPDEKELQENPIARRVWDKLHLYGIDEKAIKDAAPKGARNAIIGTYRIVLHQSQQEYDERERNRIQDHQMMMKARRSPPKIVNRSKTCSCL